MKRLKYLIMIVLAIALCGTVFFACGSSLPVNDNDLVRSGKIYRVTYNANGGSFSGNATRVHIYFHKDMYEDGIKTANPETSKKDEEAFAPTRLDQYITGWFYKKPVENDPNAFEKVAWDFDTNKLDKATNLTEMPHEGTGITIYDLELYAEWAYYLYVDYSISYVGNDLETYEGSLTKGGTTTEATKEQHTVVTTKTLTQQELLTYMGETAITHSSGTAVPEPFDEVKHAKVTKAEDVPSMYYSDAELTQRVSFPLDSDIAPKPQSGANRVKLYAKFFNSPFKILAAPSDLSSFTNSNYFLWRDINFLQTNSQGVTQRKEITAGNLLEDKIFMGNGKTLSNLVIKATQPSAVTVTPEKTNMGMFSRIINSEIKNLTIENCAVYFNVSQAVNGINCGLLAGTISGNDTKINEEVKLSNVHGYIRNDDTQKVYDVAFGTYGDIYNSNGGTSPQVSVDTSGGAEIRYMNVYVKPAETKDSIGYTIWQSHNVARNELELTLGELNQELKERVAVPDIRDTSGSKTITRYITLEMYLTEIEDVYLNILGVLNCSAEDLAFEKQADGRWLLKIHVPEGIKAGKIIVKWNNEIEDVYSYIVDGGSGNVTKATNLKQTSKESLKNSYDKTSQTFSYSGKLEYYTPSGATDKRPVGYAVPLRLRLLAKIADKDLPNSSAAFEDIKISINGGEEMDISNSFFNFTTSHQIGNKYHYTEFWMPVVPNQNGQIKIRFVDKGYEVCFNIVALEGEVNFLPQATPANLPTALTQQETSNSIYTVIAACLDKNSCYPN